MSWLSDSAEVLSGYTMYAPSAKLKQTQPKRMQSEAGTLVALRRHWLCSSRIFITIAPHSASACKRMMVGMGWNRGERGRPEVRSDDMNMTGCNDVQRALNV